MTWFTSRSARPRRAIKPPLSQRPGVRIAAAAAGGCFLTAVVAGSMLQFSFAGDDGPGDPSAMTTTSPALEPNATTPSTGSGNRSTSPTPRTLAFETCREVREAGAYPLRRGEPGYGRHLDRNGNGLACEPE